MLLPASYLQRVGMLDAEAKELRLLVGKTYGSHFRS